MPLCLIAGDDNVTTDKLIHTSNSRLHLEAFADTERDETRRLRASLFVKQQRIPVKIQKPGLSPHALNAADADARLRIRSQDDVIATEDSLL